MLVRKGISQGKVRSISTLARSGNNVSLIYLEHFLIYLRVPNFLNQFLVSRYNTIIKKAFRKKSGARLYIDQWNFYGPASGGQAPVQSRSFLFSAACISVLEPKLFFMTQFLCGVKLESKENFFILK